MISKEKVREVFRAALEAVLPANLIKASVSIDNDHLRVKEKLYPLDPNRGIHVFGSGKASLETARAMEEILGERIAAGLVVPNYHGEPLEKIDVFPSSHPVPTEESVKAAELLTERLSCLKEDDFFIYLLSGGSSALVEKPVPPLTLAVLMETNQKMLKRGLPIYEMNTVRKHLSLVKGGRMGRLTRARGVVLVISDVIGDRFDTIGSAPFFYDPSSFQDAHEVLQRHALWDAVPEAVQAFISGGLAGKTAETPKEENPRIDHLLLASNLELLRKAREASPVLACDAHIMTSRIRGEARETAKAVMAIGEEIMATGHPFAPPVCLLFGGETTVTVRGSGKGGRNQEMCLAALQEIREREGFIFLSAGTDGIDGDSDAAGAVVDGQTYHEARRLGLNIGEYLERNDSHEFFRQTGDLIVTGPTGTNVMDMMILYIGKEG